MKRVLEYLKVGLIISALLFFIIYLALSQLCKIGIKCKNCTETSVSKQSSINDGFFIGTYKALKDSVKLKYHDETIDFGNAWFESQWFHNSDNCLNTKKEKKDGYNIVVEFKKSNADSFLFTLSTYAAETSSGMRDDRTQLRLSYLPDTLWLQIHEKNPVDSIGWTQKLEGEVIGFVKK